MDEGNIRLEAWDEGDRRKDVSEELMDQLLVITAPKSRRSMLGGVAWIYDKCAVIEKEVGVELRKPERRNPF